MYTRIAVAIGIVVLGSMLVRLVGARWVPALRISRSATIPVSVFVAIAAIWVAASSTLLLWVVPLCLIASFGLGVYGARSLASEFPEHELRIGLVVLLLSGVAVSGAMILSADPAIQYISGPYAGANVTLLVLGAWTQLRRKRNDA